MEGGSLGGLGWGKHRRSELSVKSMFFNDDSHSYLKAANLHEKDVLSHQKKKTKQHRETSEREIILLPKYLMLVSSNRLYYRVCPHEKTMS